MIRLVSLLQLIALSILVWLCLQTEGRTAIVFSFVGFPVLGLALLAFGVTRWRQGAFGSNPRPPTDRAS